MARFISLGKAKKTDKDIDTKIVRTEKGIVKRKKVYADTSSGGWY